MNHKRVLGAVVIVGAMTLAFLVTDTGSANAADQPPLGCTVEDVSDGTCLGFVSYDGEDPMVAAVAGALQRGKTAVASRFGADATAPLSAKSARLIHSALAMARIKGPREAAEALQDAAAGPLLSAPKKPAPKPLGVSALAPTATSADGSAPQASHGQTLAMSYYYWLLHGNHFVKLYYGDCDPDGCRQAGYMFLDFQADTYFPSDGPHWYSHMSRGDGVGPGMKALQVRIFQDISNEPDQARGTIDCPQKQFLPNECNLYGGYSHSQGNWYYFRVDFTINPLGYESSSYQGQTRRWKTYGPNNWQFVAYENGG